ncbi:hypothetical protein, partial [Bilophila sp. 4_1_30]|uniref:hypothetical protein n=1 Tax=Bilophila sp. 4_1_30 TaxID=693988 RepID=UPI001E426336
EGLPSPLPRTPSPHPPKTFDFIESLFGSGSIFSVCRESGAIHYFLLVAQSAFFFFLQEF